MRGLEGAVPEQAEGALGFEMLRRKIFVRDLGLVLRGGTFPKLEPPLAELEPKLGGRLRIAWRLPLPGQVGRIGVEAETDLTAALLNERRKPIGEAGKARQPPLTWLFKAEPAENRGTLPPGIVILSPVRGLTP